MVNSSLRKSGGEVFSTLVFSNPLRLDFPKSAELLLYRATVFLKSPTPLLTNVFLYAILEIAKNQIECCGWHFENMKMYCCEFENTKDGSFNFSPENLLNRQLIFTLHLTPYQEKNYRWVEYDPGKLQRQDISAVELWEKKHGAKCSWKKIEFDNGHVSHAWVIKS